MVNAKTSGAAALAVAALPPEQARDHLRARLALEVDPDDLAADLAAAADGLTVVDARGRGSYAEEHIVGAHNLPYDEPLAPIEIAGQPTVAVVYGAGPGCNAATRVALRLAEHGVPVKELVGGLEYWVAGGLPTTRASSAD